MRNKLIGLILVGVMGCSGISFASARIPAVAQVEQGLIPDSGEYNGRPVIFSGTNIGANKNYFSQLQISVGERIQAMDGSSDVGPRAIIRLVVSGIGTLVFNPSTTQYNAIREYNTWMASRSSANVLASPIVLEASGWKFNPQEFVYMAGQTGVGTKKGTYPLWTMTLIQQMSLEDFNTKFMPAFNAWNQANQVFVFDKSVTITNNTFSGQHIYYNSARFGSLAADLQNFINQ